MSDRVEALVRAAAGGDREAFGALVELSWDRLVRLARSMVGDIEAEDAVQDALVAAWRKLRALSDAAKFDAWVGRIVYRECLHRLRQSRRHRALEERYLPSSDYGVERDEALGVWELLARLPPRQRAVLHLTVVEGMSDREIGAVLGLRPGSVRAHRRRVRETIAKLLEKQGGCSDPPPRRT